jgi:type III pantothenate kinase
MILAIDAGNTRIKWGTYAAGTWRETGACVTADAVKLSALWSHIDAARRIIVANVAGEVAREAIIEATVRFGADPEFIVSQAAQCGVRSSYEHPEQLGCDRWAALIGAHRLYPGASLVVNAGTALTVDALSDEGLFLGGIIVPGIDLMRRALDAHTAGLRWQPGEVRFFPNNTGDAIMSGAAQALAGAIERTGNFMSASGQDPLRVILSGGTAETLRPLIALEAITVENIVLEGLAAMTEEGD